MDGRTGGDVRDGDGNLGLTTGSKGARWRGKSGGTSILNNCIVLKNLDYKITYDSLVKVIRHVMPSDRQFVEVELVDDRATGSFRGMAFVTFANGEDAALAIDELAKLVINERKVYAEYRRVRATDRDKKLVKKSDLGENHSHSQGILSTDRANGVNSNSANSSDNSVKAIDKRSHFFANRGADKRTDANHECARELEFRELLSTFAKGWVDDDSNDSCAFAGDGVENGPVAEGASSTPAESENRGAHSEESRVNGDSISDAPLSDDNSAPDDIVFDASLTSYERRMVHIICDELKLGHISRFDEDGNRVLRVTRDRVRAAEWAREESENQVRSGGGTDVGRRKNGKQESGRGTDVEKERPKLNYYCPRQMAVDGGGGYSHGGGGIRAPSYRLYTPRRQPSGPDGSSGFRVRLKFHGLDAVVSEKVLGVKDGSSKGAGLREAKESKGKSKPRKGDVSNSHDDSENVKDAKVHKGKGKGKNGGKGRKTSNSSLNPLVPAYSPNGES